jgi:hypothetical protein
MTYESSGGTVLPGNGDFSALISSILGGASDAFSHLLSNLSGALSALGESLPISLTNNPADDATLVAVVADVRALCNNADQIPNDVGSPIGGLQDACHAARDQLFGSTVGALQIALITGVLVAALALVLAVLGVELGVAIVVSGAIVAVAFLAYQVLKFVCSTSFFSDTPVCRQFRSLPFQF